MSAKTLHEFELIKDIKKWLRDDKLAVNIGDDAAAFNLNPNKLTLFSSDSLVESVHFDLRSISAKDLGYKSLVANVSDIAAMGGAPSFATVSIGLSSKIDKNFIRDFYRGLSEAATKYNLTIAGGDISSSNKLFISISILGQVEKNKILKRSTAKVGNKIFVTGSLGAAAAGLKFAKNLKLDNKKKKYFLNKHFRPKAKLEEAKIAAYAGIKTAIDISDGLMGDCQRICEESSVGCTLYLENIPIDKNLSVEAKNLKIKAFEMALCGGEDYELLLIAPATKAPKLLNEFKKRKLSLTLIGEITSNNKVVVVDSNGNEIKFKKGYEHII